MVKLSCVLKAIQQKDLENKTITLRYILFNLKLSCYFFPANTPKGCEINGKKYNDGDTFYLNNNCRNRCTCQNGHYGCVDLCPQEYTKPSMIFCPNAELMPVRGQCCKEWSCLKPNKTESNKIPRHIANNYKLRPQNNPTWGKKLINMKFKILL